MAISEFQLALIGVGAAAVTGVWAYNQWQEYRSRQSAENIFRGQQDDALIDEQPGQVDAVAVADLRSQESIADERVEPRFDSVEVSSEDELVASDGDAPVAAESADSDWIAPLEPDVPGEDCIDALIETGVALASEQRLAKLYAAWRAQNAEFRKRIRWVAKTDNSEWTDIADPSGSNANHAYVVIQLADRQGAIDKTELTTFFKAAEALAEINSGCGSRSDLDEIVAHANALDEICADVDIQIAIHIVGRAGQSFAGSKLRGLLEVSGLQLAPDGFFYLLNGGGKRLLSVCNSGAVPFDPEQMRSGACPDVTFWLDVPRVADGGAVFDIMLATARQLAGVLNGVLVDDQRNPLADSVLAGIRAKVVELQTQMAVHGIPAGGRRALRLFA